MILGRRVIQRPLQFVLTALLALASSQGRGGEPLYIIERSTLQTRNFTPIVNHEVLLMNLGERPLVMDVNSAVPPGKWQKGPFWPAFLADSQLPDPMFSPLEIAPKKTTYLPQPQILEQGTSGAFFWKDVQLAPGEATIGQYDNWYGEAGVFWTDTGLTLPGLRIRTTCSADSKGNRLNLGFFYEVENLSPAAFDDLAFEVFVPLTVLTDAAEIKLLEATEIATSPNFTTSLTTRSDGFGRAASGVAAVFWGGTLESRGKVKLHLKVSGKRTTDTGTMWPLLSLRGRSLAGGIWPQAEVKLAEPAEVGRFSYLAYNLVLPDSRALSLGPRSARILRAAEAKKLGP